MGTPVKDRSLGASALSRNSLLFPHFSIAQFVCSQLCTLHPVNWVCHIIDTTHPFKLLICLFSYHTPLEKRSIPEQNRYKMLLNWLFFFPLALHSDTNDCSVSRTMSNWNHWLCCNLQPLPYNWICNDRFLCPCNDFEGRNRIDNRLLTLPEHNEILSMHNVDECIKFQKTPAS